MSQQCSDLIVFDWDSTLTDSTSAIARSIQLACRGLDLPVPDDARASHMIGLGLRDALEYAVPTPDPVDYSKLADRYRFHYPSRDAHPVLFPGVREMLEALRRQNYLLAVTMDKSRTGLQRAMETANLTGVFGNTRCTDETFSEPYPAVLLEPTRDPGVEVERTTMIGGTTYDLQMTANAGAAGVAAIYGVHPADVPDSLTLSYSARLVPDLYNWLTQHA